MERRFIILAGFILFICCAQIAVAQQVVVRNPLRYLALGDSYTIGQSVPETDRWPRQLAERLKKQNVSVEELRIIAQTGWRTDDLLDAIERENPASDYNLVSLLIGVNNQYQGTSIEIYPVEFRQLLNKAIELCGGKKEGVFVLSIPDYGYTPFGEAGREFISAEIDAYNRINREIAQETGVAYFDITSISREAISKPEYLAPDQLHPSGIMYGKWVDLLFDTYGFRILTTAASVLSEAVDMQVYPNPAGEHLQFNIPQKAKKIVITNASGMEVFRIGAELPEMFHIPVSGWKHGIYFFRIQTVEGDFYRGKFVVGR